MKLFWVDKGWSSIIKDNELGFPLRDDRYDNPSGKTGYKKKHIEKDKYILYKNKNIKWPIIWQLNINSINYRECEASKHLGVLSISETKIDESVPSAQFSLNGFNQHISKTLIFHHVQFFSLQILRKISKTLLP